MKLKTFSVVLYFIAVLAVSGCGGGASASSDLGSSMRSDSQPSVPKSNAGDRAMLASAGETSSVGNTDKARFKKTVAVSRFENKAAARGQINLGRGMSDQLADALVNSGNFVVVERQTLSDVFSEQDLARSGRAARSKTAQTGKVVPSQILIKGTITEFESETSGGGSGLSFKGITLGQESTTAHVGLLLRIIDTTSGEVLASERVEGKAESGGTKIGLSKGGYGFETEGFKNTPLGKATQIAIDRAVFKVIEKLNALPFQGKIINVKGETIYTNIGERNGATPGDVFTVYSAGEDMIDPDTGENLGAEEEKVGTVKITSVKEKFSKASIASGQAFAKGFLLKE